MSLTVNGLVVILLVTVGCAPGVSRLRIRDVAVERYTPSPMAVGQDVDVNHHRARFSGLAPAPALQAYLQRILDRLLAHSPVSGIPAKVYVSATSVFGAESSADANIFVNFRSLELMSSEDEVAALVAHELAHIILRHPSADSVEDVQARLLTYTNLALAVHGAVAQQTGMAQGVGWHESAVVAEAALLQLNQGIVGPAWNRAQETSADMLGLDLLILAGYAPTAMETLLDTMIKAEADKVDERSFGKDVRALFKDRWPELMQGGRDEMLKEMTKMSVDALKEWLKRTHPETPERKENVVAYRQAQYADRPAKEFGVDAWENARKKHRPTKRLFQSYGDAITAAQLLKAKDDKGALKIATEAATKDMKDHTFVAETLFRAQNAAGARKRTAESLFTPPVEGTEPAWLAFQEMGLAQIATAKSAKAGVSTMERGYQQLQKPPDAIGPLLFAYQRTGKREEAEKLIAECQSRFPRMAARGGCVAINPEGDKTAERPTQPPSGPAEPSAPWWTKAGKVPFAPPGFGH